MNILLNLHWTLLTDEKQNIEQELFILLASIEQLRSLQKACDHSEISYRYGWDVLNRWEKRLKTRLILKKRGRGQGTHLTQQGKLLLRSFEDIEKSMAPILVQHEQKIQQSLKEILHPGEMLTLDMHASHDGVIESFVHHFNNNTSQAIALKTMGSLRALEHLLDGHCHIAGFHLVENNTFKAVSRTYKPLVEKISAPLLQVCQRTQGMLVQSGNPHQIKSVKDIHKKKLRFINRQANSGSRLLFDTLLADHGIKESEINGYEQLEFTHDAVAAMIASDAADVGFANQAAAERFKLDFIPCVEETYFLAFNELCPKELFNEIRSLLSSDVIASENQTAGYDFSHSGRSVSPHQLLKKLF